MFVILSEPLPYGRGLEACILELPLLSSGDKGFDDLRVGQRRGVAQLIDGAFADLAEDPPHDLAGTGLGQSRGKLNLVGTGMGADLATDGLDEFLDGSLPVFKVT